MTASGRFVEGNLIKVSDDGENKLLFIGLTAGIKELKADFSVDSVVTRNFWATEACGNFIVMAYNFFSLFRHALINSPKKSFLKTIRYELVNTPAYFSRSKDRHVLYLARSLKTRSAFQGIWTALDYFNLPYKV